MRGRIARSAVYLLGVTTIYVTHDQVETMTMGDRVAVMRKGKLQQVAQPEELSTPRRGGSMWSLAAEGMPPGTPDGHHG